MKRDGLRFKTFLFWSFSAFVLVSSDGLASSAAKQQPARENQAIYSSKEYVKSSMNDKYGAANTSLSLMSYYNLKVRTRLDQARAAYRDDDDRFAQVVRGLLKGFCHSRIDRGSSATARALACFKRYKRDLPLALRRNQIAQIRNSTTRSMLEGGLGKEGSYFQRVKGSDEKGLKNQKAYYARLDELTETYVLEKDKLEKLGQTDYVERLKEILREPLPEDFVERVEVPVDPEDPSLGTRIVFKNDGAPNMQAYYKAHRNWIANLKARQDELRILSQDSPRRRMPGKDFESATTKMQIDLLKESRIEFIEDVDKANGKPSPKKKAKVARKKGRLKTSADRPELEREPAKQGQSEGDEASVVASAHLDGRTPSLSFRKQKKEIDDSLRRHRDEAEQLTGNEEVQDIGGDVRSTTVILDPSALDGYIQKYEVKQ